MNNKFISQEIQDTISGLLQTMAYFPSTDSDRLAVDWLEQHSKTFSGYVNGLWVNREELQKKIETEVYHHAFCDHFSGKVLCDVYITNDIKFIKYVARNSAAAFTEWSSLPPVTRSIALYKVAESIKRYQSLYSIVESLSSGKHLHKVKTKDIPNLIESFCYYAGCALSFEKESTFYPDGPVCVIAEEFNNPLLSVSWRICSLLASGNSVLLLADVKSCLSAFLLAEICSKSGIPPGVLNVLPVDQGKFNAFGTLPMFSKLVFTGSLERGKIYSELSSKAHIPCEVLIPRRPIAIVYENTDLYSAASGILESFYFHDTRCTSGGCKIMVQESIFEKFLAILKTDFQKILVGRNTSKTDLSCIVSNEQKNHITEIIKEAEKMKVEIHKTYDVILDSDYMHMRPLILSNLQTNSKLVHEELGGPIIVTIPFRTVKESVSMFNCDNKGSPVSIWCEKISVAIEVAHKLKSGTIWLNSQNLISPTVPFSGVYLSGNSVEGGQEAYYNYLSVAPGKVNLCEEEGVCDQEEEYNSWLSNCKNLQKSASTVQVIKENMAEYQLYIGGTLKQSANGRVVINKTNIISNGSEADVQSAISSAFAAQPKWGALSICQRSQILFSIMENLHKNKETLIAELQNISKNSVDVCDKEVEDALDVLYYWAIKQSKYSGKAQEISRNVKILQEKHPLGVIGIKCSNEKPLLSFLALLSPAIMFGNTAVVLASEKYPTPALELCEIFIQSGVPAGVINVISGNSPHLVPYLCKNRDVNAIWYSDIPCKVIYSHSHITQRVFNCKGMWDGFNEAKSLKYALESTFTKTIYFPAGEIFAN